MNPKKILLIACLILITGYVKAQFKVDAQIRPRYELRDGYKSLKSDGDKPMNYISQRSRIQFAYQKEDLEFMLSFQDVHEWGSMAPKKMKEGVAGLHEAWVKLKLQKNFFIQVGRQGIQYDNGRLLSAANWNQVGFSHDALRLGYVNENWQIETAVAYNHSQGFEGSPYELMNTIWVSRKAGKVTFSLLNLADMRQKNDSTDIDYLRNTVGPIINYKSEKLVADLRTFYQHGKQQSGMDVSAYYINTDLTYKFNKKFKAIGGVEIKSGNDATNTASTTDNAFDIMYGARHKFNGLMDYFNVPSTTKGAGLIDYYAKLGFSPAKKIYLEAQWHYFNLHNNYMVNDVVLDEHLGNEIDLSAKIKFNKSVELYLSYSTIFGTETLEAIKGGDKDLFNSYAVVMLTVKPNLFKSEKQ